MSNRIAAIALKNIYKKKLINIKSTVLSKKIKKSKDFNTNDIARRINISEKLQQFCFSKNF